MSAFSWEANVEDASGRHWREGGRGRRGGQRRTQELLNVWNLAIHPCKGFLCFSTKSSTWEFQFGWTCPSLLDHPHDPDLLEGEIHTNRVSGWVLSLLGQTCKLCSHGILPALPPGLLFRHVCFHVFAWLRSCELLGCWRGCCVSCEIPGP